MKDCKTCDGEGLYLYERDRGMGETWKLCPCLTERIARLERVAALAKRLLDPIGKGEALLWAEAHEQMRSAVAALEGDSHDPA